MAAFELALAARTDGIELDVHLTGDGKLVVIHDDTVNRTTDGKGPVGAFTLAGGGLRCRFLVCPRVCR